MAEKFTVHIKHMVCPRCIRAVREEAERLGLEIESVTLGELVLGSAPDTDTFQELRQNLHKEGFEIISDHKSRIVNRIKTEIINVVHHGEEIPPHMVFSSYLADKIGADYSSLSTLFSSVEGITIEKYIILQKVEKIKELIVYDELTFSEIAYRMGYSSSQHLSTQFKKVTGLTPSHFKNIKSIRRTPIDRVGE
jgi:AraC family transcriptional regulator